MVTDTIGHMLTLIRMFASGGAGSMTGGPRTSKRYRMRLGTPKFEKGAPKLEPSWRRGNACGRCAVVELVPRTERTSDRMLSRGFTLLEIMVVVTLIALLSGAVAVSVIRAADEANRKTAKTNAITLAQVAEVFIASNRVQGCPTPEELKQDGLLSHRSKTKDPWGTSYEIRCEERFVVAVSAGKDQTMGTGDDISSEDP